jgi:starch synthase
VKETARGPGRGEHNEVAVAHLCAEYWPFARTGGLAEAVRGMATFQAAAGIRTMVFVPLYRSVREACPELEPVGEPFRVRLGSRLQRGRLFRARAAENGPRLFFVQHAGYFDREGIYGRDGGDFGDNHMRFAFFSKAVLDVLPKLWQGGVVLHAHDWHAAFAPIFARTTLARRPFCKRLALVLSVHNAGYQGHFPFETLREIGLPERLFHWKRLEWHGRVNVLKGGVVYSDLTTTVSHTHALELRTPEGGFGLHDLFISLGDRLVGIPNGIDQNVWNPATDPEIPFRYSREDLSGKQECKKLLQKAYGLPVRSRTPIFAMTARLVQQKGLDLVIGSQFLRNANAQLVILGEGEPRYHQALRDMASQAAGRMAMDLDFCEAREHRLLAGADVLLMPSLYEPCGLTQMRAQRYGDLPVARRVGGLADTIRDQVTGFLFDAYSPEDLDRGLKRAATLFRDRAAWRSRVQEAMSSDFGWGRAAERYLQVYRRAEAARPTPAASRPSEQVERGTGLASSS